MVKTGPGKKTPRGNNTPRGNQSPKASPGGNVLKTNKGVFTFTMVTDGCYVEHKVRLMCVHAVKCVLRG